MAFALPAAAQEKLTVYTYESFTAEWGPGPAVEKAFEAECKCDLQFVAVADGVAILNRLKLEGASTQADIALGLDTNLTWEARQSGIFAPHGVTAARLAVPGGWSDDTFLPFDYGYFAVVYDGEKIKTPPASLKELELPTTLPGIKISTSGTVNQIYTQMQLQKWNGKSWEQFGAVLKAD